MKNEPYLKLYIAVLNEPTARIILDGRIPSADCIDPKRFK